MNVDTFAHCRTAVDKTAAALQDMVRAFHPNRSRETMLGDLKQVQARLSEALLEMTAAIECMDQKSDAQQTP